MGTTPPLEQVPEFGPVANALRRLGKMPVDCVAVVSGTKESFESQTEIFSWKERLRTTGITLEGDELERLLLTYAVQEFFPLVAALPVHGQVKTLIQREMQAYSKPPGSGSKLLAGTDPFVTACKIATLRRFASGPLDWVISGIPRSWIPRIPWPEMPQALLYVTTKFQGLKPAFYVHVAPTPRNRSLVIPKEVRKAYYRMAKSLELQPEMRGVLCASWFHDPAVLREMPHLAALNEPYLQHGGRILSTLGAAPPDSGFLDYNPERRKLYETGQFKPRIALAMWPRAAAISWAAQHSEMEN
jgi:hypothetical protein